MSKRNADAMEPEGRVCDSNEDDGYKARYVRKLQAWQEEQPLVQKTLSSATEPAGILALPAVVKKSLLAHVLTMKNRDFVYGKEPHSRSLLEEIYKKKLRCSEDGDMGKALLDVLRDELLPDMNDGSKPELYRFSLLVMHSDVKYTRILCELIYVLQSKLALVEDLDLLWDFLERLWCMGHPVLKPSTSQDLGIVCVLIKARRESIE